MKIEKGMVFLFKEDLIYVADADGSDVLGDHYILFRYLRDFDMTEKNERGYYCRDNAFKEMILQPELTIIIQALLEEK